MSEDTPRPKDSELQAADGPPDPELDSLIAPQGYSAEEVDDIATMQTPAQQRRSAIRFLIIMVILLGLCFWFCTPANLVVPDLPDAPYGIHERPTPPTNKFLIDTFPRTLEGLKLVDIREEQIFAKPYVGATVVRATYVDDQGNPATAIMFQADSHINTRRILENYKTMLEQESNLTEYKEKLYISENFIQWAAPGFADQAYGIAWNNGPYFVAVFSPIREVHEKLAQEFPY